MKKTSLRLAPLASIQSFVEGAKLVAFNVGPDERLYLVIALGKLDCRTEDAGGAGFPKPQPDRPQAYRVVGLAGGEQVLDMYIEDEAFNLHDIQPLGDDLLLVCARSDYRGPDDVDLNGRVYDRHGRFLRGMLLGDGIQTVQTTSAGDIWTSFFDEGVFGSWGWEHPVGVSGLVAWDPQGHRCHEFDPAGLTNAITDCYALNVATSDDVWCCYYTGFPLVHLRHRKIAGVWPMPVHGSDAFAISGGHALFNGGHRARNTHSLIELGPNGKASLRAEFELYDELGNRLEVDRAVGRGSVLHLVSQGSLYGLDVQTALAAGG